MTEYRIDDLARAAGTTARNVRAYQERGLLPPPEKRGRVGYYNDSHLVRLKLIDSLLSRGFTTVHPRPSARHPRRHRGPDASGRGAVIREARDQIIAEHGEGWMPEGDEIALATDMLQRMRAIGTRSVEMALARAMDQALQDELGAYVAQAMAMGAETAGSAQSLAPARPGRGLDAPPPNG